MLPRQFRHHKTLDLESALHSRGVSRLTSIAWHKGSKRLKNHGTGNSFCGCKAPQPPSSLENVLTWDAGVG